MRTRVHSSDVGCMHTQTKEQHINNRHMCACYVLMVLAVFGVLNAMRNEQVLSGSESAHVANNKQNQQGPHATGSLLPRFPRRVSCVAVAPLTACQSTAARILFRMLSRRGQCFRCLHSSWLRGERVGVHPGSPPKQREAHWEQLTHHGLSGLTAFRVSLRVKLRNCTPTSVGYFNVEKLCG